MKSRSNNFTLARMAGLRLLCLFVIVVCLTSCAGRRAENIGDLKCESEKLKEINSVENAKERQLFLEIVESRAHKDRIRDLVGRIEKREELITFAKTSRQLGRFDLECKDSAVRFAFELGFWVTIEKLAEDRSEGSLKELKLLKTQLGIDGGDSYDWMTIVDRVPAP